MDETHTTPALVRWTQRLEETEALDGPVSAIEPTITSVFGSGTRGALLRGEQLGHALHPVLTDLTLGSWTSATVLDLVGGPDSAAAARRLVGLGLLTAGPTAWSGWAEWAETGPRDKRVGLVHAISNGVAAGAYAASWIARRQGHHRLGAVLALGGAGASGVGAYLGGHLAIARDVGSRDPAFGTDARVGTLEA
ncbi:(2Fe-2S)-binding protein [Serinicoccus kebangsaanensis]|uniref:(2Fe-2S)-binding protein n=1 Tax=Serinicoccus kebangsaanensis TaxID=2602069 RepID=UPI00124D4606|nr:(2Fe-2S)-binding protein [Serinicoccus kebangsaanensis]